MGYQYFLKALKDSNNLDAVQNKKLVVSAVPTGAPVILKKGIFNDGSPLGVYGWTVQLPMELDYRSSTEQFKQRIVLTMLITRVPTLESPSGVGIASFVIR
jgi:intracellular multiplication protein IcmL